MLRQLLCSEDIPPCLVRAGKVAPKPCRRYALLGKPGWEAGKEGMRPPTCTKKQAFPG